MGHLSLCSPPLHTREVAGSNPAAPIPISPLCKRAFLLHWFGGVGHLVGGFRHWCLLVPKPPALDEVEQGLPLIVAASHHVRVDAQRELRIRVAELAHYVRRVLTE